MSLPPFCKSNFLLLVILQLSLHSVVNAAVAFYDNKEDFLSALNGAKLRTAVACTPYSTGENKACPWTQGDLTFKSNHWKEKWMQIGAPGKWISKDTFQGASWYKIPTNTINKGMGKIIETKYPFTAMGFEAANEVKPNTFAIKIFDDTLREYDAIGALRQKAPARFYGWISDSETANSFEIGGSSGKFDFVMTNFIYAVSDDVEAESTSLGDDCPNYNPVPRSTVCKASAWGDPHIVTFDTLRYDAQAKGEVILLTSTDSDLEIQGRFESIGISRGNPAVTTGISIRDENKNSPVVQVSMATTDGAPKTVDGCPVELYVNGESKSLTSWEGTNSIEVGVQGDKKIILDYPETNLRVEMKVMFFRKCHFWIDVYLTDCESCRDSIIGLLGSPNQNPNDDWMTKDGTVLELPSGVSSFFFKPAFEYSVENWLITNEQESLFGYEPNGKSFSELSENGSVYDPELEEAFNEVAATDVICDGDIGCLIDEATLGEEAAVAFKAEPAAARNTANVVIAEPTSPPTKLPTTPPSTSAPTPAPTPAQAQVLSAESSNLTTDNTIPIASSNGDPHFKTWKNEHFEYHGQCDLILVKDKSFANGIGLEVQIRTKLIRFWSYIKSAAILIGDDIFEVEGSSQEDKERSYWINLQYQGPLKTVGGFPVTSFCPAHYKCLYEIDLSSKFPGQKIEIATYREFVRVDFKNGSEESYGNAVGLLGDYKTGKTLARDGVTLLHDFHEFGNEWQVLPFEDMLFHDVSEPQFPQKCTLPEDPRGARRRRLDESSVSESDAEKACSSISDPLDRKDCVYDILATQDLGMVGAY